MCWCFNPYGLYRRSKLKTYDLGYIGSLRISDKICLRLHDFFNRRRKGIVITAALIGVTLIVEIALFGQESFLLQALQRASITGLTAYFLISNFNIRPGFFFKELPKLRHPVEEDIQLHEKLLALLKDEKIYRKEGLTIGELAAIINEQEYRLRRMINGQLGFKNFNDFLNQYRIHEACEILTDHSQNRKTILEIAYALGYQSIGPFNKAFREQKGSTPTAFRKANQHI